MNEPTFTPCVFVGCPLHHPVDTGQATEVVTLEAVKANAIVCALGNARGNMTKAARLLDVDRATLYRMARRAKIDRNAYSPIEPAPST